MNRNNRSESNIAYKGRAVKLSKAFIFILVVVIQNIFIYIYFLFIKKNQELTSAEFISFQNALTGGQTAFLIIIEFIISGSVSFINKIKIFFLNIISWIVDRLKRRGLKSELSKINIDFHESVSKDLMFKAVNFLYKLKIQEKLKLYDLFLVLAKARFNNIYTIKDDEYAMRFCLNELYDSAKNSKFLLINANTQYEFIGKYFEDFLYFESKNFMDYPDDFVFLKIININKNIKIKILLLDPDDRKSDEVIKKRMLQLKNNKYSNIKEYKNEIRKTIDFVEFLKSHRNINIEYRFYNVFPIFRYYITDNRLFFSQYIEEYEGHESMVFEIEKDSKSLYFSFMELFEQRWNRFN